MPAKKYKIILSETEREYLKGLVSKGKVAARKLIRARILLKAESREGQCAWTDQQIGEALDTSRLTIEQTRKTFVEEGLEAALNPKRGSTPVHQKFDGRKEAHLIATACSAPPEGRKRWTLPLLADKMVELHHFESISHEAIRQSLKKTKLNLG